MAWSEIATGWTLQVGDVAYDWDKPTATLYRKGSAFVAHLREASCIEDPARPGQWNFAAVLDGRDFHHRFVQCNVPNWPFYRAAALKYWGYCFFLEAQRAYTWPEKRICLGAVKDMIHNLHVTAYVVPVNGGCVISLGTQGGDGCISRPYTAEEWPQNLLEKLSPVDPFEQTVRAAILSTPDSAANVRDYFWRYLVEMTGQCKSDLPTF